METWVLAPEAGVKGKWTYIAVGRELFLAMKQTFKSKSSVPYIWIDALCINQGDLEEKAIQLGLMGDMYAQSVRTVAWLGEGTVFDLELARCYMLHIDVLPAVVAYVQENVAVSLSEDGTKTTSTSVWGYPRMPVTGKLISTSLTSALTPIELGSAKSCIPEGGCGYGSSSCHETQGHILHSSLS
jgi:hypothetical protein